MREWLLALLYASIAAAIAAWLDPPDRYWTEFARNVALFTPPMRWALHVEGGGSCWLSRVWP